MDKETEKRNCASMNLDQMSVREMIQLMNEEDQSVIVAIQQVLPKIEQVIEAVIATFQAGGRLIYVGAGTSGRLGILDAVECVPTFDIEPGQVIGLMAGGDTAIKSAVEGAEDSLTLAQEDLQAIQLSEHDFLIGLSASGSTPYVKSALAYAKECGVKTASIANNPSSDISALANIAIEVVTGPEVLTGSTRLKAGTAQKLVLNMISTASLIKTGKAYQNLMIDVQGTNQKLIDRSIRIISEATGLSYRQASEAYELAGSVKLAIVMVLAKATKEEAEDLLVQSQGFVRQALELADKK